MRWSISAAATRHCGAHQPPVALDPHDARTVDHHFGDLAVGEQRLERDRDQTTSARTAATVASPVCGVEQWRLFAHQLRDEFAVDGGRRDRCRRRAGPAPGPRPRPHAATSRTRWRAGAAAARASSPASTAWAIAGSHDDLRGDRHAEHVLDVAALAASDRVRSRARPRSVAARARPGAARGSTAAEPGATGRPRRRTHAWPVDSTRPQSATTGPPPRNDAQGRRQAAAGVGVVCAHGARLPRAAGNDRDPVRRSCARCDRARRRARPDRRRASRAARARAAPARRTPRADRRRSRRRQPTGPTPARRQRQRRSDDGGAAATLHRPARSEHAASSRSHDECVRREPRGSGEGSR